MTGLKSETEISELPGMEPGRRFELLSADFSIDSAVCHMAALSSRLDVF